MSDSPPDDPDNSSDDLSLSPFFGKKIAPSYHDKRRVTLSLNPSLLGDDTPTPSNALTPEDEELILRQSEESKRRFLANPVPGAPAALLNKPLTYDEARTVFLSERNGERGRPSLLTPERVSILTYNIRLGTPIKIASVLAGIAEETIESWLAQGRKDITNEIDSEYARFAYEIFIADRELKSRLANKWVKIVSEPTVKRTYKEKVIEKPDGSHEVVKYLDKEEEQGDGNWQGIAEYLARTEASFRKTERIEQTGANGGPIQVQQATIDISALSPEERRLLLGIVEKVRGKEGE